MNIKSSLPIALITLFTYAASGCNNPSEPDKQNAGSITQLDTTSQNFTFETYLFGDGYQSSFLYDAWIFDKNNIWVTGSIGPIGEEPEVNILKWNGARWQRLGRVFSSDGINNIWALDSSNVFFALGAILNYNKGNFNYVNLNGIFAQFQGAQYIWGSSDKNIWAVGRDGTVVYYNGTSWNKIPCDSTLYFTGLTGSKTTGIAYAIAQKKTDTIIMKLFGGNTEVIYSSNHSNNLSGPLGWTITLPNENELYIGYGDIWKFNLNTKAIEVMYKSDDDTFLGSSFAAAPNDIYYYGTNSKTQMLVHYNGRRFKKIQLPLAQDITHGIKASNGIAVALGFYYNKASAIFIKRQPL